MGLEDSVEKLYEEIDMERVMIVNDIHGQYHDKKAVNIVQQYNRVYKPTKFVIAGDLADFYSISRFDKSPERKDNLAEELKATNYVLDKITKYLPKYTDKILLEGNHEYRLQHFIWKNPAFYGLEEVDIKNLLHLEERNINLVRADGDYWKKKNQCKIGDTIIMHGDNRLDGASSSKYSGYSAKNTMYSMGSNIVMGHVHRGAVIYNTQNEKTLTGMETGCLCEIPGTANWQQGFGTFEIYKGKSKNFIFHKIENGKLYENGKVYRG